MAELNDSQITAAQIERVRTVVPVLFERDDTWFSGVPERTDVEIQSNRDIRGPLNLRPGGKFAHYNPDSGSLGLGSGPVWDKFIIGSQHLRHNVQWTKKAEWGTDDPRKAVVKAVRNILANAMSDFRRHLDSLCLTNGQGVLATVTTADAGTPETITCTTDGFGVRLLRFDQEVAFFDSILTTNRTAGTDKAITFWDLQNKTIKTATPTAGLVAGDKIVVGGLGNVTGANVISLLGVPYHHSNASSGFWMGISRALNPEVRANRVNANGALALPFPRRAINAAGDRGGVDQVKKMVAWMHPCQKQAYEEMGQLVSVINKSASEEKLDLYFGDNMQMAGAPVKQHFSWDKTRIDFIAKELWGRVMVKKADFYEVEGRTIFELRDTTTGAVKTSQVSHIVCGFNLFQENPALGTYIDALAVPVGY